MLRARRPGGITVSCPHGRYVQCVLRGTVDPANSLPIVLNPPDRAVAPDICTKPTVFVPDEINPLRQHHLWGSREWQEVFGLGRAAIEGDHGQLKSQDQLGLSRWITRSSHMDVVGLFYAQIVARYNLHKVRTWVADNPDHPAAARLVLDPLFGPDHLAVDWLRARIDNQRARGA